MLIHMYVLVLLHEEPFAGPSIQSAAGGDGRLRTDHVPRSSASDTRCLRPAMNVEHVPVRLNWSSAACTLSKLVNLLSNNSFGTSVVTTVQDFVGVQALGIGS